MEKYSNEFKLKVIKYCIEQKHGIDSTAKYFNIPSSQTVRKWIKRYKENGLEGLLKNNKSLYDGKFKQNVVEYMHENHLSLQETSFHFKIGHHRVVKEWNRIYYEEGPQGLYRKRRGGNKNMSLKSKNKKIEKKEENDLEAENRRLRMENEYLKKLNALVQERIKRENKIK